MRKKQGETIEDKCLKAGIKVCTYYYRISKGMSPEEALSAPDMRRKGNKSGSPLDLACTRSCDGLGGVARIDDNNKKSGNGVNKKKIDLAVMLRECNKDVLVKEIPKQVRHGTTDNDEILKVLRKLAKRIVTLEKMVAEKPKEVTKEKEISRLRRKGGCARNDNGGYAPACRDDGKGESAQLDCRVAERSLAHDGKDSLSKEMPKRVRHDNSEESKPNLYGGAVKKMDDIDAVCGGWKAIILNNANARKGEYPYQLYGTVKRDTFFTSSVKEFLKAVVKACDPQGKIQIQIIER